MDSSSDYKAGLRRIWKVLCPVELDDSSLAAEAACPVLTVNPRAITGEYPVNAHKR